MSRVLRALPVLAVAAALSACVADGYDTSYGVGVGYGTYGYDPYYDDYGYGYGYPYGSYSGSLLFGGTWYNGPFNYRHGRNGREYWYGGGWRRPDGERGGQWRDRDNDGVADGRDRDRNNDGRPDWGGDNRPNPPPRAERPIDRNVARQDGLNGAIERARARAQQQNGTAPNPANRARRGNRPEPQAQ